MIKTPRTLAPRSNQITLSDCLMSGLAMFSLKFPSLLKFDEAKKDTQIKHNLRTLFHVQQAPSDTYMRERNDEADPRESEKYTKKFLLKCKEAAALKNLNTLISTIYWLAMAPEPIMKTDGAEKNDCERNASRRLYSDARREHPHLKLIVVEDGLASNVPHLSDLQALNMRYIIGVKPSDHKFLFGLVNQSACTEHKHHTNDGKTHYYRYLNQVQLNKKHPDFKTNFIEYWETDTITSHTILGMATSIFAPCLAC
jgi:hypothetical protein